MGFFGNLFNKEEQKKLNHLKILWIILEKSGRNDITHAFFLMKMFALGVSPDHLEEINGVPFEDIAKLVPKSPMDQTRLIKDIITMAMIDDDPLSSALTTDLARLVAHLCDINPDAIDHLVEQYSTDQELQQELQYIKELCKKD